MLSQLASRPTPGARNEDYALSGPGWVVVLDGATPRPGVDSGCVHGPAWLVRRLAVALAGRLVDERIPLDEQTLADQRSPLNEQTLADQRSPLNEQTLADGRAVPLADLLAAAIADVRAAHGGGCDLGNPDSPSAAVALLRCCGPTLDWLVLADCAVVLDVEGDVRAVVDDRTARLPGYTAQDVRTARNSPGGFWVAGTRPEAAYEALTGSAETGRVHRAAVLTDGATRLVERFGLLDWRGLLDVLEAEGPVGLIRRTRAAEAAETAAERAGRRGKHHDDATAVLVVPEPPGGPDPRHSK